MKPGTRTFLTIIVVALFATHAVFARTHHRAPKRSEPAATITTEATSPPEKNRDPADVALDRRIKGICRGC
jgi:hypothetical protein